MRQFEDELGTRWDLYEVSADTLAVGRPEILPPEFRTGWLVFESSAQRRRLAPFPREWSGFSVEALRTLLNGAEVVGPMRRWPLPMTKQSQPKDLTVD